MSSRVRLPTGSRGAFGEAARPSPPCLARAAGPLDGVDGIDLGCRSRRICRQLGSQRQKRCLGNAVAGRIPLCCASPKTGSPCDPAPLATLTMRGCALAGLEQRQKRLHTISIIELSRQARIVTNLRDSRINIRAVNVGGPDCAWYRLGQEGWCRHSAERTGQKRVGSSNPRKCAISAAFRSYKSAASLLPGPFARRSAGAPFCP